MDRARVSWLGHASTMIELAGVRIVTDPAFTPRLAHLRRHHLVGQDALVRPDLVLISHLHLDHLHRPSLGQLGADLDIVVPAGAGRLVRRWRLGRVREVAAGEAFDIGAVTIEVVPAVHSSSRGPHTRVAGDAVGYVARGGGRSVYFAGDTALFPQMSALEGIDVALLPIWGWGPTLGPGHLDPCSAALATTLVDPRMVVPIHWGTYSPIGVRRRAPSWLRAPLDRFVHEMHLVGAADRALVVDPGGVVDLEPHVGHATASRR